MDELKALAVLMIALLFASYGFVLNRYPAQSGRRLMISDRSCIAVPDDGHLMASLFTMAAYRVAAATNSLGASADAVASRT